MPKLYKVSPVFSIPVPGRFRLSHGVLGKALAKLNYAFVTAKEIKAATAAEDKILTGQLLAGGHIRHKYAVRLQVVSRRANGKSPASIAEYSGINTGTVTSYVKRYNAAGPGSLPRDKTRKPGTPPVSEEIKNKVTGIACRGKPEDATRRGMRKPVRRAGISHNKAAGIPRTDGIKPHIQSYYSYSSGPDFEAKLRDAAGLYMNPPDNATVLCAGGKTQIQAPGRARHTVFPRQNLPAHQSRDCCRHGTAALFTAPDYLTGNVIGDREDRHTSEDYLKFIKKLNKECEDGKTLHIIAGNYKTRNSKLLKEYIAKHPNRFVLRFTPAHSSRLNLAERFFREIATERIRRESRHSADEPITAIRDYIKTRNKSKRKFYRSKSGDDILRKINKHKPGVSQA